MEELQNAIEIVDGARQYKYELECKTKQLSNAICQVQYTSSCAQSKVKDHFKELKCRIIQEIQERESYLIHALNELEEDSLLPLNDSLLFIQEGINEASEVLIAGECILSADVNDETSKKQVRKFISSSQSTNLSNMPEIPSVNEIPSLAAVFDEDLMNELIQKISIEGTLRKHAPVQIHTLWALPGAIRVDWERKESNGAVEVSTGASRIKNDTEYLYRLQCCIGRALAPLQADTSAPESNEDKKNKPKFEDVYVGSNYHFTVRNLSPNIYTFRVSSCISDSGPEDKRWSQWSVYQEKMVTIPSLTWDRSILDANFYSLAANGKIFTKTHKGKTAIFSTKTKNMVGYPVVFEILSEGKARDMSDCFSICSKVNLEATALHLKDGSFALCLDGSVWMNGSEANLKFPSLRRGMKISVLLTDQFKEKASFYKGRQNKDIRYRVCISVLDQEGIFDWYPFRSTVYTECLHFASIFKYSGWKISIL